VASVVIVVIGVAEDVASSTAGLDRPETSHTENDEWRNQGPASQWPVKIVE
jgi:hypothetical protein